MGEEYKQSNSGKRVNAFKAMKLVIELLRGGSVIEYERKLRALEEEIS